MEIKCDKCGATIPPDNVNVSTMIAKCDACHTIFDFTEQVTLSDSRPKKPARARQVPLPPGITVQRDDMGDAFAGVPYRNAPNMTGSVTIIRRWFQVSNIFMMVFALFWDGIIAVFYVGAFKAGGPSFALLFPLLHVAVGVFITYLSLANFLNQTTIKVGDGRVTVRHHPLWWPGNHDLPADSISQVYCTRELSRNRRSRTVVFDVHVALKDGSSMVLVKGLPKLEQGLYIEQEIENALGIVDVPVVGEVEK